jgi:hypothetical protein
MAMGTRRHRQRQEQLWVAHEELPTAPGHPFYRHLNELLDREKFDEFAEKECCVWQVILAHFGSLFWPTLRVDGFGLGRKAGLA